MLSKIVKNTTNADIFINEAGVTVLANSQIIIDPLVHYLWAKPEMATEIGADVLAGNLIINNGVVDLSPSDGLRFLENPERLTIQDSNIDSTRVVTTINFTGDVVVTDNGNGKTTVAVGTGILTPNLREVTMVMYPFGPVNITSDLLFEADPVNDTILFLKEEVQ